MRVLTTFTYAKSHAGGMKSYPGKEATTARSITHYELVNRTQP